METEDDDDRDDKRWLALLTFPYQAITRLGYHSTDPWSRRIISGRKLSNLVPLPEDNLYPTVKSKLQFKRSSQEILKSILGLNLL